MRYLRLLGMAILLIPIVYSNHALATTLSVTKLQCDTTTFIDYNGDDTKNLKSKDAATRQEADAAGKDSCQELACDRAKSILRKKMTEFHNDRYTCSGCPEQDGITYAAKTDCSYAGWPYLNESDFATEKSGVDSNGVCTCSATFKPDHQIKATATCEKCVANATCRSEVKIDPNNSCREIQENQIRDYENQAAILNLFR